MLLDFYKKTGFTVIEIIFVTAILALLSGLALIRANPDWLLKTELSGSAQRVVGDLRLTRSLAVTNAEEHRLVFVPNDHEYAIYDSSLTQVGETRTLSSDITISGDRRFIFEALGNVSRGSSVSLSALGDQYDITVVAATGMITSMKR